MTCSVGFGYSAISSLDPPAKEYPANTDTGELEGTTLRFTFTESGYVISDYGEMVSDLEQTCSGETCDDLSSNSQFTLLTMVYYSDLSYHYQYEVPAEFRLAGKELTKVHVSNRGTIDFAQ